MDTKVLGRVWAAAPATPNIDPGADKYNLGWIAEIPIYQMLNFINNRHDTNTLSLAERGQFQWGSDITYVNGATVWNEADGFIYVSKVNAPSTTLTPNNNATQWERSSIQITRAQYDTEVNRWNSHTANMSNPHQLTCAILDTYTRAEIDAKVNVPQTDINNHVANRANPHVVTAAQVGAVPVTGGSYTGLVNHLNAATGVGAANLNAKINSDTGGTFIQKGVAKIGLDATSQAVFINDLGASTNLLSEADYLPLRESVEATFVPPFMDFGVDFRNSINIKYGMGDVVFTAPAGRGYINKSGKAATAGLNEPRQSVKGLQLDSLSSESLRYPTLNNLSGFQNYTIVLDCELGIAQSVWGWLLRYPSGTKNSGFYRNAEGVIYLYSEGGVQKSIVVLPASFLVVNTPLKFGVTYDGTTIRTYVQGFLYASVPAVVNLPTDGQIVLNPDYQITNSYNSLKIWAKALTDRQVSNT
jgi:hypothetical protein